MGNTDYNVTFGNVSSSTCLLSGSPRVTGLDASGRRVALPAKTAQTFFVDPIPADIAPGEAGYLNLASANPGNCPGTPTSTYTALRFQMPGGGYLDSSISVTEGCGILDESGLGKRAPDVVEPTAPPGTAGTLSLSVALPPTVDPGMTLKYVITLSNTSGEDVKLDPCPSYTELVNSGKVIARSYFLDCDYVRDLAVGAAVRYAMELAIPTAEPVGIAKFSWSLNTPEGPDRGSGIAIGNVPGFAQQSPSDS
jgi:hypothetical protein